MRSVPFLINRLMVLCYGFRLFSVVVYFDFQTTSCGKSKKANDLTGKSGRAIDKVCIWMFDRQ